MTGQLIAEIVTTAAQAEDLRVLRNECREFMTNDTTEISEVRQSAFFADWLQPGLVRAFLLRRNGMAVAYGLLRPDARWYQPAGTCWLSCGVAAASRGQGYGTAIVQLLTAAGLDGGGEVRLEVWQDNTAARHVYAKAGYQVIGTAERGGRILETMGIVA